MFYSESDIDYTLQMFDAQYKNLHRAKLLEPYHQKATATLFALFQDLKLPQIEKVLHTLSEVNVTNILKLLHKCKQLMEARRLIVEVMRDLELHEALVRDIRSIAD
jgi:archaellum biogenesis ATPase FlaH